MAKIAAGSRYPSAALVQLEEVVRGNLRMVVSFECPVLLAFHASIIIACMDSMQQGVASWVWMLVIPFGTAAAVLPYLRQTFGTDSQLGPITGRVQAAVILLYNAATLNCMGYRTAFQDATCCRLAGLYLAVACAKNQCEAALFLAAHLALVACSSLANSPIDMLFLILTDICCLFVAWVKGALVRTSGQLLELSGELRRSVDENQDLRAMTEISRSSVHAALRGLCRAVVLLCADLRLAEDCPELAAMLKWTRGHAKKGRSFSDYVFPEDARLFREHMALVRARIDDRLADGAEGGGARAYAGSVTLRLLDVYGDPLEVRLFQAAFGTAGCGAAAILLGVCELEDEWPEPAVAAGPGSSSCSTSIFSSSGRASAQTGSSAATTSSGGSPRQAAPRRSPSTGLLGVGVLRPQAWLLPAAPTPRGPQRRRTADLFSSGGSDASEGSSVGSSHWSERGRKKFVDDSA